MPHGRATACKPCRAFAVARQRAAAAAAEAEPLAPAPKPKGRGPERVEPGAILVALEELGASGLLVVLDVDLADVPRELRCHAVRGVDGKLVLPRRVLLDWVKALRARVGEYHMRARPQDLGLNARVVDTDNVAWARRRRVQSEE